jgi:hypothetical protein
MQSAHQHIGNFIQRIGDGFSNKEQRSLRMVAVFFLCLLMGSAASAQRFRLNGRTPDKDEPMRWLRVEKSFGVVPEIDFVNGSMGINLCRGKFMRGTHDGMAGTGYYLGYAYDTDHKISVAGFGAWVGLFSKRFGGQVAIKGVYCISKETQVFGIRPEAGIGFPKAQLNYGYNFYTGKTELPLPTHTLTLYVYFGLHSERINLF